MTDCPKWNHKLTVEQARFLSLGRIVRVDMSQRDTSADSYDEFLTFTNHAGYKMLFADFLSAAHEAWFSGHNSLVCVSVEVRKSLRDLAAWEAENAADLAEFNRLKEKLGK